MYYPQEENVLFYEELSSVTFLCAASIYITEAAVL